MLPRSKFALAFLIALPVLLLVALWRTAYKRPRLWGVLPAAPLSLALSHDGSTVAFESYDGTLVMWPRAKSRQQLQPEGAALTTRYSYGASPIRLQFSSDDQTLLASNVRIANSSTALYAWDMASRHIKWSALSPLNDDSCRYWASPDGTKAVQRSYDKVKVLDISGGGASQNSKKSKVARAFPVLALLQPVPSNIKDGNSFPQTIALAHDNKTLAVATPGGRLEFWDAATGQHQFQTAPTSVSAAHEWDLQYSPDDRFVALFDGATLSLWDVTARKWSKAAVTSSVSIAFLAWMPDSRSLWTGAGSAQQWSAPTLQSLRELPVSGPITVSGDGATLVTRALSVGGVSGGIWAWNIG